MFEMYSQDKISVFIYQLIRTVQFCSIHITKIFLITNKNKKSATAIVEKEQFLSLWRYCNGFIMTFLNII